MTDATSSGVEKDDEEPPEYALFTDVGDFVRETARGVFEDGTFALCFRASFAKCYEFNIHAWCNASANTAFLWLPTLRGICEDVIVLNFCQHMADPDRKQLFNDIIGHEMNSEARSQEKFFSIYRPHQPVIGSGHTKEPIKEVEKRIHQIWKRNGWPNMDRGILPPTRQIAEKSGKVVLTALYEYLYRLTSATVHFNVHSLMRTGWGPPRFSFSIKHYSQYYVQFGRIYGAFLFCCYFELFEDLITPDSKAAEIVSQIRRSIVSKRRWPEMMAYEEFDMRPPDTGVLGAVWADFMAEHTKRLLD